jgi:biopolymer transport protein ExbB/TolQ
MITVFSGGVWSLIHHADLPSKIILILLLALSVLCWSLFLYVLLRSREQRFYIARSLHKIAVSSDSSILSGMAVQRESLAGEYAYAVAGLLKNTGSIRALDARGWDLLQQQLLQRAEQLLTYNESITALLSTSASIAPLLGLLGTVWGLVHAFMNIAMTQSADITAVAPGIAEALITTIAGLLVAIPALVMYNIVLQMQNRVREDLYEMVDAVVLLLHRAP